MKTVRSIFLASAMLVSVNANAECTLKTAQTKMVETTNMMQVYNREKITYMENDGELPESFERKFNAFNDRSNELVAQFGKETDANPDIGFDDPVSQSLCDGYDKLFADYAPQGYAKKEVNLQPTSAGADCTTNGLWEKYGKLIQKQAALTKEGRFTDAESAEMMRLGTRVGQDSTTDLASACVNLDKFADIINSK